MPRPRIHHDDVALDAARALLLQGGTGAATTAAISSASGAPTGSIYHRFGSRNDLLAELWVRTIKRFQFGLVEATSGVDPGLPRALAAADWVITFASEYPEDARLLMCCRREELLGQAVPGTEHANALKKLNRPIEALARQIADETIGTHDKEAMETILLAMMDVPYGSVRRHLRGGTDPSEYRLQILDAVRAIVTATSRSAA